MPRRTRKSRGASRRSLAAELAAICGPTNVLSEGSRIEEYSEDMAGFRAKPAVVARPGSEEEVRRIVVLARRRGTAIVPRGAGSSLTGASVSRGGVVLDMRRMDAVLKVDTVNWYARAQAGVTIEDLNKRLEKEGFFFPPDPASSSICTVGGAIAEGSGGLRCVKYGTMKDWVLSLRVVLADGGVANFGEPLAKNRAGFDLVHLMVGSEGTLGIVTEAFLKIIPLPTVKTKRLLMTFDDWSSAGEAICGLRSARIQPVMFEFLDREVVKALNEKLGTREEEAEATLIVDIEEPSLEKALEIFRRSSPRKVVEAKDDEEAEAFYQLRAMAYLAIRGLAPSVQIEDISLPIDRLTDYLVKVREVAARHHLRIPVNGHAGDGNVHPVILYDGADAKSRQAAFQAFEEICRYGIGLGGSVTGEHGVGAQKAKLLREQLEAHDGAAALRLMKGIKKLFDPEGVMNPGKYVEAA
ncbi:MAG TPA: FAD-linked oxidase C-terminal domain-containing protein [Nitrososphaerales archaeon]|nr:FAD-linked oxidase C-terminal domain-containing protein [Nitrososphaerales archaeon]